MLHIYKNKQTGRPKGDATISYEEAETAQEKLERKIGLGMLSSRMQRVEMGVTGRNRGPPPLTLFKV